MKEEYCKKHLEGKTLNILGRIGCEEECPYNNQIILPGYDGEQITLCSTEGKKYRLKTDLILKEKSLLSMGI